MQLAIYVYGILIRNVHYWNKVNIESLDSSNGEEEPLLGSAIQDQMVFDFPESPTYTPALTSAPINLNMDGQDVDDLVSMGTSAPISIRIPGRYQRLSVDASHNRFSKSLAPASTQLAKHEANADSYQYYLNRHSEVLKCVRMLNEGKIRDVESVLTSRSRHLILPRFSLLMIEVFKLPLLIICRLKCVHQ